MGKGRAEVVRLREAIQIDQVENRFDAPVTGQTGTLHGEWKRRGEKAKIVGIFAVVLQLDVVARSGQGWDPMS
jgi:hypothetical protein